MLQGRRQATSWRQAASSSTIDRPRGGARAPGRGYELAKRILDVTLASILLIILSPLMLLIAIAIKLDSPGPVIYVQRRLGKNGRVFRFYKFRSMTADQDHTVAHREFVRAYINGNGTENQQHLYKPAGNGRCITRVGRILRRTSLDELPQLVNVIKGDMSLVGPRALPDYELEQYNEWHRRRLEVLPGITGLAQISGRSRLTFNEIVSLDIKYIENRSLALDLWILLKTIPVVLSGKDAG
ncbi:MAG TPA: sugar transferase [Caldilineae bacterium]|jgi:lipopolysaccharide/colanic/teichoic acid biosynthesis glycosyltransferase|nr:sugar transferase [Caldilineae bacterium]